MSLAESQLDHYHLSRMIGSGGMGEVYLATDTRINRQVAIKVIRGETQPYPDSSAAQDAIRNFHREAKAIASLDHAHILPLFDYGEVTKDGQLLTYMVMPYRAEGTLNDWLRRRNTSGLLPPELTTMIIEQAAGALQHAHNRQIIHQDVKPTNFLIRANPDRPQYPDMLLADFGIARFITSTSQTAQGMRGTPSYMAPEQWQGRPVPASDQYALAIMAYELLTGRVPFQGNLGQLMYAHACTAPQPLTALNPHIPPALNAVVLRALAKDPDERFPSIAEFARAFRQAGSGATSTTFNTQEPSQHNNVSLPTIPRQPTMPTHISTHNQPPYTPPTPSQSGLSSASTAGSPPPAAFPPTAGNASATTHAQSSSQFQAIHPALSANQGTTRKPLLLLVGLALLVLIIIGGSVFYFATKTPGTTQNGGTATATTASTPTTAPASTSTSIATPTNATTDPYPPNAGSTLALDDPLQNNSKGYHWEESSDTTGDCAFAGSAYHAKMLLPGTEYCYSKAQRLSNFAYQAQVTIITGQAAGLIIRSAQADQSFYFCALQPDGTYLIDLYTPQQETPTSVLTSGSSAAIHKGLNQSNLLAVVAHGQTLDLYVNMTRVASVNDDHYTSGYLGVAVHAEIDQNTLVSTTEATFTNAKVWKF